LNNKWNPDLYLKYADERTQPSHDLISRIKIADPANIIDIGCGPGNSTRVLREKWPNADITGLDSSQEMIDKARSAYPQEHWILANAASWQPDTSYSLVFSNATLQWLPSHESLIKKLFDYVQTHGALAVQVPANSESPLHLAVLRVSKRRQWRVATDGCDRLLTYHEASFYYDQLSMLSKRLFIWHTIYYHVMASHQDLLDWYASTGMKSYLDRLPTDDLKRSFQSQVLEECRLAYPEQQDGKILFPFQRLFFVAYKE
jgi:trans-aconitate 2-methyltransferase